jgi:phage regulator Rha-like protein
MSVIRFPTCLISTLEISEALGWPHSELMKDAHATAEAPKMPDEWFRPVHYRDENGLDQPAYNMTSSGLKMLLWNCSGTPDLRRRCLRAMGAIIARVK